MSVNLFDGAVLCVVTLKHLYCWLCMVWDRFSLCPNVSLQEAALSHSLPSRRVS